MFGANRGLCGEDMVVSKWYLEKSSCSIFLERDYLENLRWHFLLWWRWPLQRWRGHRWRRRRRRRSWSPSWRSWSPPRGRLGRGLLSLLLLGLAKNPRHGGDESWKTETESERRDRFHTVRLQSDAIIIKTAFFAKLGNCQRIQICSLLIFTWIVTWPV